MGFVRVNYGNSRGLPQRVRSSYIQKYLVWSVTRLCGGVDSCGCFSTVDVLYPCVWYMDPTRDLSCQSSSFSEILKRQVFEEVGRGVWLITSATNTLLAVDV